MMYVRMYVHTYVRTYVSVTLRNVAVTSRRNVANQRSNVIIIARKEGGAWERIVESVDSMNRDERGYPLTQYITNGGISSARNTSTHFKHHYRVLRLISNRMSV